MARLGLRYCSPELQLPIWHLSMFVLLYKLGTVAHGKIQLLKIRKHGQTLIWVWCSGQHSFHSFIHSFNWIWLSTICHTPVRQQKIQQQPGPMTELTFWGMPVITSNKQGNIQINTIISSCGKAGLEVLARSVLNLLACIMVGGRKELETDLQYRF